MLTGDNCKLICFMTGRKDIGLKRVLMNLFVRNG